MKRLSLSMFALLMMVSMVGCGGSSVSLPESAMTDELYAVQWYDTKNMSPDDAIKMLNDVAEDMSDDQPKARLWMSAQADAMEASYMDRWEAFTEAGGQGFLVLYYAVEKTVGEGENAVTTTDYQSYVLVRVKKGTSTDDLEKALAEFAKDDGNEKIKFEKVKDEDNWLFLTREGEGTPELPDDGSKDVAKEFEKLMRSAGGASAVTVWTMPEAVKEDIEKELKREGITDEQEARLKEQLHTESVVMAVSTGGSPSVEVTVNFDEKEQAESFAEEHNDGLINRRAGIKNALIDSENPPHPSVVNRLIEKMEVRASGKSVSISMSSSEVRDGLAIMAATRGRGVDTSSPTGLMSVSGQLRVPRMPGAVSVNGLSFSDRR